MADQTLIPAAYFVDIETVSGVKDFDALDESSKLSYQKRYGHELENNVPGKYDCFEDHYKAKAGLCAEFGKICCIAVGKIYQAEDTKLKLKIKAVASRDEKQILIEFIKIISKAQVLCAHNGMEFDFPFLFRRMLIHGLVVPNILNPIGKKPWDLSLEDTMVMWGGTQWKYKASLDLLANIFEIPSSKTEMTGGDVATVYYSMFDGVKKDELPFEKEKEVLDKIGRYCGMDIVVLANLYCKIKGISILPLEIELV